MNKDKQAADSRPEARKDTLSKRSRADVEKAVAITRKAKQIDETLTAFRQHRKAIDSHFGPISSLLIDSPAKDWPEQIVDELKNKVAGIWMEALYISGLVDAHVRKSKAHTGRVINGRCTACHEEAREMVGRILARAGLLSRSLVEVVVWSALVLGIAGLGIGLVWSKGLGELVLLGMAYFKWY